ncbi:MAG TPA: GPGG-motif small membrane protein [Actinomycetota bacterium]
MLAQRGGGNTDTIFWIIAAVLVIAGIVALLRGSVLAGIALIVLGLLVGPGGVSIFD